MKNITAENMAMRAYTENEPIDYKRIDHIKRTLSAKEKLEWAKENVAYWAEPDCSKHKITRAAKILLSLLHI
jgi:hypothetical protein